MGRHREAAQQQHHHSTQMGTNGPDDAAAVSGAWHTASGQRGAARTCRATASTEQTTRLEGDRQPARATHNSNEAARSWARTNRTTRPPSAALRAERAGREAPDVPVGPLPAPSRRTHLEGDRQPARATHNSNEAARRWAPTDRTTRPPSAAPRAERAGRVAPDVPAGPLRAASRRTRLPGATASRPSTHSTR